jgi:signal peptidase II
MGRHLRSVPRRAERGLLMSGRVQIIVALAVVLVDQIVKAMIRSRLMLHESITVIPGFFDLTRVHNTGAAYGFLDGVDFPFKAALLACVAMAALTGLTVYAVKLDRNQALTRVGLTLVIGGAAGNLIDRVTAGYVLDFVDLYRGNWHFWAFNVADSAITVGVVLMILELLGLGRMRVSRAV